MTDIDLIKQYVPVNQQQKAIKSYEEGEPVQYIIGSVNFYGYELKVNKDVLIPRFETEYLLQKLINKINELFTEETSIADLGTGSGAIAIVLQKELNARVTAFDISDKALEIARENAKKNCADITFYKHDIRKQIPGNYDVLVSNPPYIDINEEIESKVYDHEPHLALFAKEQGLEFYKCILSYAKSVTKQKSIIAFEIGNTQGEVIKEEALKYYPKSKITIEKDLPGKNRYIFIVNE